MMTIGPSFLGTLRNFASSPNASYVTAGGIYLLCAAIGAAWVLVQPGALGHHWDWIIPASPVELRKLATTNFYAWQDFSLGSFVSYRYTTTLMSMLLGLPGFLGLSGVFVTKTLVLGSLAGSAFSMYALVRAVLRELGTGVEEHRYALGAGILYGFSPFAYNQIVAGDQLEMISYALAPLLLLCILRATAERNPRRFLAVVAAAVLVALMSASPQTVVLTVAAAVFLSIAMKRPLKSAIQGFAGTTVLALVLCAYWILPVTFGGEAIVEGVATTPELFADYSFREMSSLFQTLTTAAEPGSLYFRALPGPAYWAFVAGWIALWSVIVAALVRRPRRVTVGLAAIYVGGALLPLGGAPIIGPAILALFKEAQPASLLFRTAQHLIFLPTLVVGLLAAVAAAHLRILEQRTYRASAFVCVAAISSAFITHSDYLKLIGPFRQSASEHAITQYVARHDGRGRLLFLPTAGAFYYHPGVYDYFFEGGDDGSVRFAPLPTLAPGFKWTPYHNAQLVQKAIDELMMRPGRENEQRLLASLTSVHFVEARAGLVPAGGVFVNQYDYNRAVAVLNSLRFLRRVTADSHAALWEVVKPTDRIYIPDCTIGVSPAADPYDLLAWANEVTDCSAPAFIAGPASEEVLLPAADVKSPHVGVGTALRFGHQAMPLAVVPVPGGSNVKVQANPGGTVSADPKSAYFVVLCHIKSRRISDKDDNGVSPHFLVPITVPEAGPHFVSFLAPDWQNRFGAYVFLHRGSQVVKFDIARMGRVGNPRARNVTAFRIANINPRLLYFGSVEIGNVFEYFSDRDLPFTTDEPIYRPPYAHGDVVAANWWGSNAHVTLTEDGGASINAPAPYFVFESDLTSTRALLSSPDKYMRLYLTINTPYAGRYLVSLLAPDWNHRFDLMVALPAGSSSTSFEPQLMSKFGDPQVPGIRRIRIANLMPFPRAAEVTVRPPVAYYDPATQTAGSPETVAQPTWNRWDLYYFGDLQRRLALRNTLPYRLHGLSTAFDTAWHARYRFELHVQPRADSMPFAVSVDDGISHCIDTRSGLDRTEDMVLGAEQMLLPGRHLVRIASCPGEAVAGDLTIVSLDIVPDVQVPVPPMPHAPIFKFEEKPGRFIVTMSGTRPTYVVFNDAYDPRWVAKQSGRVIDHLHANGFANAWFVEHPGDGSIEISFTPQLLLNTGYLVSALSFICLIGLAIAQPLWCRFIE